MKNEILNKIIKENIDVIEKDLNKYGGPFGAIVVDSDYNIVGVGWNTVTGTNDPTAHAEVNAIRNACKNLGTFDLTGYSIIATGHPCPMCLSAIMWANIKAVYYVADVGEAARIGFRDGHIYTTLNLVHSGFSHLKAIELNKLGIKEHEQRMSELYTKYQQCGQMY